MAILADCHMHSSFSGDSVTPMEEMIQQGLRLGFRQMCFTEHLDLDFPVSEKHPKDTFTINMPAYEAEYLRCKSLYQGQIQLLMGVELGLQPHVAEENRAFLHAGQFDFVIGSSHAYRGQDPCEPHHHAGRPEQEVYAEYFQSIIDNINTFTDYDVFGHLDYILRYSPGRDSNYTYADYRDYFEAIFRLLLANGKGIEVNTGGLVKGLREPHPCIEALRRYRELGGEVLTIGSDAHVAKNVGAYFAPVRDILVDCGYRYYTVFIERKPQWFKL